MGLQATVTEGVQGHRGCPGSSRVSRVLTGVWGPSRWVSKVHHSGRAGHRRSRVRRGGCPGHHGGVQGSLMDFQVCRAPHPPPRFWWPCFPRDAPAACPARAPASAVPKAGFCSGPERVNERTLITFHSLLLFEHLIFLIDIGGAIRIWRC